jgi:hypothetical protein
MALDLWLLTTGESNALITGSMHKTFIDSLPKVKNYTLEPEN